MAGSLALDLKKRYKNFEITGYARKRSLTKLKKFKALDKVETCLKKVASQSDILILGAPVKVIAGQLKKISPLLQKEAIVFDLGSTKSEIEKIAAKFLPREVYFVGCHPFCGSEKKGVEKAIAGLYRGAVCFITSANRASFVVEKIWHSVGAKVVRLSPKAHDEIACVVSHFPHLACFSLVNQVDNRHLKFSSSGFKDLTRIAASPAQVWSDIFLTNKANLLQAINKHRRILNYFETAIKENNQGKLNKLIKKANQKRGLI